MAGGAEARCLGKRRDRNTLRMADFQAHDSVGCESFWELRDKVLIIIQPIRPRKQGAVWFIVCHIGRERGGGFNIRWVAQDEIKTLGKACAPIARLECGAV